jgi:cobalt/nickel transport system permease protein
MHIPNGYLGPQTYGAAFVVMAPFWAAASKIMNKTLKSRQVPILALSAAFSFVIMMFNVPIIGGSSGHATGAVLVAIILGPWAACIAVSVALIVQALIFGDGGVTCIGANCLNMAVIMPFAGYFVYKLIAGKCDIKSKKHVIGAAVGAYIGLNFAAISTAFMLGIQPIISVDAAGIPLYAPYPLKVAVPIMAIEHLLVFGIVEAIITAYVVTYFQKNDTSMLNLGRKS